MWKKKLGITCKALYDRVNWQHTTERLAGSACILSCLQCVLDIDPDEKRWANHSHYNIVVLLDI